MNTLGKRGLLVIPELTTVSLRKAIFGFLSLAGVTVVIMMIPTAAGTERLQSMVDEMGP